MQPALFPDAIDTRLAALLFDMNPWWRGEKPPRPPAMKRWAFSPVMQSLKAGLAPVTVLRGPRQVGKTTLMTQVIEALLEEGVSPDCIFRVQFDDLPTLRKIETPLLDLPRWYAHARLGTTLNRALNEGNQVFLFLDEVQNLQDWAPQLKHLVDLHPVRVLVTGSSALRIEAGRDSLAGRIATLEMGPLLLREIGDMRGFGSVTPFLPYNGLSPLKEKAFWENLVVFGRQNSSLRDQSFSAFSDRGAYPVAQVRSDLPWEAVSDFLRETVILRAIQHDLRMGDRGQRRDEHLLEEVFRFTCRYVGQAPAQARYLAEIQQSMHANIGWQRVLAYLKFLDGTLLMRLIEPLELRLKRQKGASKLCLCDHALRAAWLQEVIPLTSEDLDRSPHLAVLAGRVADGAVGYFFRSIMHLDVAHFPERGAEPEVDFILTIGEQRIPVEVKYQRRIRFEDTVGLRSFIEKSVYNAPFGLLITQGDEAFVDDPRIVCVPLSTLLMMR